MVVAGLIVTFLVYPNSFENFMDNIGSITSRFLSVNPNVTLVEITIPDTLFQSGRCSVLNTLGESEGIGKTTYKTNECTFQCGNRNLEYHSYECKTDRLYCYCEGEATQSTPPQISAPLADNIFQIGTG